MPKYSPLLKKTCVRQVVLDKWFPLNRHRECIRGGENARHVVCSALRVHSKEIVDVVLCCFMCLFVLLYGLVVYRLISFMLLLLVTLISLSPLEGISNGADGFANRRVLSLAIRAVDNGQP